MFNLSHVSLTSSASASVQLCWFVPTYQARASFLPGRSTPGSATHSIEPGRAAGQLRRLNSGSGIFQFRAPERITNNLFAEGFRVKRHSKRFPDGKPTMHRALFSRPFAKSSNLEHRLTGSCRYSFGSG